MIRREGMEYNDRFKHCKCPANIQRKLIISDYYLSSCPPHKILDSPYILCTKCNTMTYTRLFLSMREYMRPREALNEDMEYINLLTEYIEEE